MRTFLIVLALALLIGCAQDTPPTPVQPSEPIEPTPAQPAEVTIEEPTKEPAELAAWRDARLTDVNTGESFSVQDFHGERILLETFAVWCPTCRKQQEQIQRLDTLGVDHVSLTIDTDPNEDAQKVIDHTATWGFDWRFAISPAEVTQSLIDEFGIGIVAAPQAPVILICEDGSARKLSSGVKSAESLANQLESCA